MLHLTKVAFGCATLDALVAAMERRRADGGPLVTTRNRPIRHAEVIGGSLYWIIKHQLVARQEITGFSEWQDRRWRIELAPDLILVVPVPRRAHQGWRYLAAADAPADLAGAAVGITDLPPELLGNLARLGLV